MKDTIFEDNSWKIFRTGVVWQLPDSGAQETFCEK